MHLLHKLGDRKYILQEAFLFFITFIVLFRPAVDPDFWWHLKLGEEIFLTHNFQVADVYSFTFPGYVWADSYWLSEVLIYLLYEVGGIALVPFVLTSLLCFFIVLVTKDFKESFAARIFVSIVAALGLHLFVVAVRPMLFSSILLFLVWSVLYFEKYKKYIYFLPMLFLLWANLHSDFVIGLSILFTFAAFEFYKYVKRKVEFKSFAYLAIIALISALATLVNPYGLLLHKTLLDEALTMPSQGVRIAEWQVITYEYARGAYFFTIFLIAAILCTVLNKWIDKKGVNYYFAVLVILVTSILCFRSAYFLRILSIWSVPFLYHFFKYVWELFGKFKFNKVFSVYIILQPLVALLYIIAYFLTGFWASLSVERTAELGKFPFRAGQFIKTSNLNGNVFNTYIYGGYMMYFLSEHKVFIDGRMPAWRTRDLHSLENYVKIIVGKDTHYIDAVFEKYDISWVFIAKKDGLYLYLIKSPSWKVLYEDDLSVIFQKV